MQCQLIICHPFYNKISIKINFAIDCDCSCSYLPPWALWYWEENRALTAVADLFQFCVGNKVTEQIMHILWSYTKITVLGSLFQINIARQIFLKRNYHPCSILKITLNISWLLNMWSFLIIVVKVQCYKDSDVAILRKFEPFTSIVDIRVTRDILFD